MKSLENKFLAATIVLLMCADRTSQYENMTAVPLPMSRLYNDIIAPYNYITRPVLNPLNRTTVYIRANFMHLIDVNEISSTITINLWLQIWWQDEIRTWNPVKYDGIDSIRIISREVWRPTLLAINSNDQRYLFESEESSIYIMNDGKTHWYCGQALSFACAMDLSQFPFDSQTCVLSILTRDFDSEVELTNAGVGRYDLLLHNTYSEWDVISLVLMPAGTMSNGIDNRTFITSDFSITIKRKAGFFLLNTILPVNLLTFLSLVTFVIPDDSGEKISYSVTVLLSTGIYLSAVSSTLPQSSENLPIVMIYLFALDVYCAMTMLVAVATMKFRQKYANNNDNRIDPAKDHSSDWMLREKGAICKDNISDTISNQNSGFSDELQSSENRSSQAASTEQVHIRNHSYTAAPNQMTRKSTDIVTDVKRLTTSALHSRPSRQSTVGFKNWCLGVLNLDIGIILVFLAVWVILTATFVHEMTK